MKGATMNKDEREMLKLKLKEGFGITMLANFVPWNVSRNRDEKYPSLNWLVSLLRNGVVFISNLEYSAGCAHCPSYKHVEDHDSRNWVMKECLQGLSYKKRSSGAIMPDKLDVVYSLLTDGDVNGRSFEEWASDFGYDTDSRKAEQSYRACLAIESSWRKAFSAADLELLRALFQDY
jgi:hypothetical protein